MTGTNEKVATGQSGRRNMPVRSCGGGKWRIGNGKCIYDSKAKAERAFKGYLGSKFGKKRKGKK